MGQGTTFGTRGYLWGKGLPLGQGTASWAKGPRLQGRGETGVIRLGKADSSRLDRFSHRLRNGHNDDDDDDDDIDNDDAKEEEEA